MEAFKRFKYQPLVAETEHQSHAKTKSPTQIKPNTHWRTILFWSLLLSTSLSTLMIFLFVNHRGTSTTHTQRVLIAPCGHTPEQAMAAGCTFDVMMDEWLQESCRDRELTEEFESIKDWPFYTDENRTRRLSREELSLKPVAYTTLEYHVAHCSFALRKLHRAISKGWDIETNVASEAHTTHCAEFLRGTITKLELSNQMGENSSGTMSIRDVVTPLHPGYPACMDAKYMRLS